MTGGWGGLRSDLLDLHSVTKLSKTSKQVIVLPPLLKMNRDIPPRKPLVQIDRALKQIMKTQVHLIYAVRAFDGDASHTVARPILDRLNDIASVGVGAHDIPQREAVGEKGTQQISKRFWSSRLLQSCSNSGCLRCRPEQRGA